MLRTWTILLAGLLFTFGCTKEAPEEAAQEPAEAKPEAPAPEPPKDPFPGLVSQVERAFATASEPTVEALVPLAEAAYLTRDKDRAALMLRLARAANPDDPSPYLLHGAGLLSLPAHQEARDLLFEGERRFPDEPGFAPLIERCFDEDPDFVPEVRTLQSDVDLDAIKYLGGGSTIVLRFIKDKKTIAAFKPRQTRLQSDYRGEVAAWRLCPLIRCGFDIPRNQHVRLTYRQFDGLYRRLNSPKQRTYAANLTDVKITREGGEEWVHGTMKDWVPGFTLYPIEIKGIWKKWLSLEAPISILDGKATEVLSTIERIHPDGKDLSKELTEHMGEMPKRALARQISNLLVFDFLSNNWDRFSGVKAWWGINCQFANGRFLSIDNGAAFPRTASEKVDKKLFLVQRFSRQTIHAIRNLDEAKTMARLFPDTTDYEKERFATFWNQRQRLLDYVDNLIAEHGEDEILAFE